MPTVEVVVVRSPRRRKTVQAREVGNVLQVSIPATMTRADEERWVAEMVRRVERRSATAAVDLGERAALLADRHDLQRPTTIRWADNQRWRWGSCTPADRSVRISSRLVQEPGWVLDYVIVHELAHLDIPRHGPAFWALVDRYRLAERARGFLMARALTTDPAPAASGSGPTECCDAADGNADGADDWRVAEGSPPRQASRARRNRRGSAAV